MLQLKSHCERCQATLPAQQPGAWICSYECTFCSPCCVHLGQRCPNCGGDLQRRPTRQPKAEPALSPRAA